MILSFSTRFKNKKPTCFVRKIWMGLILFNISFKPSYNMYMVRHFDKFSRNPDNEPVDVMPKIHTIRKDINNRWRTGRDIHFTIYPRSNNMFKFAPIVKCVSTQVIQIKHAKLGSAPSVKITIDGSCVGTYTNKYSSGLCRQISRNDGFDTVDDFFDYFNEDFTGKLIHWTSLKY